MREISKTTHVTDTLNKSSEKMWGGSGDKQVRRRHTHTKSPHDIRHQDGQRTAPPAVCITHLWT